MSGRKKIVLSIGMIFKNEKRCLERCLKSLQLLRAALPCELVMADTGSDDGSREVAEKYADVFFDFPWTGDFSAARNAVMDRCSGKWFFSLDADEWLDEDISQLVSFLKDNKITEEAAGLTVRNYLFPENPACTDFVAVRMLRLSSGLRYQGRIHEYWAHEDGSTLCVRLLKNVVLHHDGYVMLNDGSVEGQEKLKRNRQLLKKELEERPEDLKLIVQCIESCGSDWNAQLPYIRQGLALLPEKKKDEAVYGANLLRYAVHASCKLGMPEFPEWLALAEELFPNSMYTMVDIQFDAAEHAWREMNCPELICRGKRYISGVKNYRAGRLFNVNEMLQSPLRYAGLCSETTLRIYVARAQIYEG
ncbi:MAG: glycosyltransferase, partial [Oscillospiraceae bacterium]|nr:glycosyltransferase [Oscillospiraceae bacterium]